MRKLQHVFHDLEKVVKSERWLRRKGRGIQMAVRLEDVCSEWFVLMLSNHVERALHDADLCA